MSKKSLGFIALFILFIAVTGGAFFLGKEVVGDFRTIDLPDGRSVIVLRRVEDAFPMFAGSAKAELDLALKQKKEVLNTTVGGKYEASVTKLYEDLDVISNDLRTSVVSAYIGLLTRISALSDATSVERAFAKWDQVLQLVISEAFKIREINRKIAEARTQTSGGQWDDITDLGSEALELAKNLKAAAKSLDNK